MIVTVRHRDLKYHTYDEVNEILCETNEKTIKERKKVLIIIFKVVFLPMVT